MDGAFFRDFDGQGGSCRPAWGSEREPSLPGEGRQSAARRGRNVRGIPPPGEGGARLDELLRSHGAHARRVARGFGLDPADADDAVQQAFIAAAARLRDIHPGSERAFLIGTVSRVARRHRRRPTARYEVLTADPEATHPAPGADEQLDLKRVQRVLMQALSELPEKMREVFVLSELEGWTLVEIGRLMGDPQGTVASRVRRGRARMRALAHALLDDAAVVETAADDAAFSDASSPS